MCITQYTRNMFRQVLGVLKTFPAYLQKQFEMSVSCVFMELEHKFTLNEEKYDFD